MTNLATLGTPLTATVRQAPVAPSTEVTEPVSSKARPYQQEAMDALLPLLDAGRKVVVCMPTGGGKSWLIAMLCAAVNGRVLVISHRQELLEQDKSVLNRYAPEIDTGIYCAGLNQRDTDNRVIFGAVASIHKRINRLQRKGAFQVVVIDECHMVSPKSDDGTMYGRILDALPGAALCGFSATPYRLGDGLLHKGNGAWFDHCLEPVTISDLVADNYLAPLVGIGPRAQINTDGVHIRQGEFITGELAQIACDDSLVNRTVRELIWETQGRRSIIVFCINIDHANMVLDELCSHGENADLVTSKTPLSDRASILDSFKSGRLRWLVNIDVCSVGFDSPRIDCIASLRPTMSKALWVQQCGRGMRISPETGKKNCVVLDFGGNVKRHGELGMFPQYKKRTSVTHANFNQHNPGERKIEHSDSADIRNPLTGTRDVNVLDIRYRLEPSKKYPGKTNLVAIYYTDGPQVRKWLCMEYDRGARYRASLWFKRRGLNMPATAREALNLMLTADYDDPVTLSIWDAGQNGRKFPEIALEHFDTDLAATA